MANRRSHYEQDTETWPADALYTFDELNERAQATAIDWYRELIEPDDYAESVIEDAIAVGTRIGITIDTHAVRLMSGKSRQDPTVYWSLHVQGSGASVAGRYQYQKGSEQAIKTYAPADAELHTIAGDLAAVQAHHRYGLTARITPEGGQGISAKIEVFDRDGHEAADDVQAVVADALRMFMDWIYRRLNEAYDDATSDATIAENIRANEYTFREDGERED